MFSQGKSTDWGDEEEYVTSPSKKNIKPSSSRWADDDTSPERNTGTTKSAWGTLDEKDTANATWGEDDARNWPTIDEKPTTHRSKNNRGAGTSTDHARSTRKGGFERDSRDGAANNSGWNRRSGWDDYGDRSYDGDRRGGGDSDRRGGRDSDYERRSRGGGDYDRRGGGDSDEYGRRGGGDYNRRAGGDYDRRGGSYDRRNGGDYGRRRYENAEPELSAEKETGIVAILKESFGFLNCADRDGDMFFHFSEAPEDVQVGDEVEFYIASNERAGKLRAMRLNILPKGTIKLEEISSEKVTGTVHKGIQRGRSDSYGRRGFYDDASSNPAPSGLIELVDQGKSAFVPFTVDDVLDKKNVPRYGDEVEFNIAVHKRNKKKRATNVSITRTARDIEDEKIMNDLEKNHQREHGIVASVRDSSGFISCCDRRGKLFFHVSQVEKPVDNDTDEVKQIEEGDSVSFYVYENRWNSRGRSGQGVGDNLCALKIKILPKGSVTLVDVIHNAVLGKIIKVPRETKTGEAVGQIRMTEQNEEKSETSSDQKQEKPKNKEGSGVVAFHFTDIQDAQYHPVEGDTVQFDVVYDKRTKKQHASNLIVIAMNDASKETGKITSLKEDFGFIKCCDRPGDAYFRFSDVVGQCNFREGTEVSFNISTDSRHTSRSRSSQGLRASRVEILPHGTIVWEKLVGSGLEGTVGKEPARRQMRSFDKRNNSSSPPGTIKFSSEKVCLDLFPDLKATVLEFLQDEEQREYSFSSTLSAVQRAVIHRWCDINNISHQSEGTGADRALKIKKNKICDGDAEREEATSETSKDITMSSTFTLDDVNDPRYQPRNGDIVRFDLVLDKRTKTCHSKRVKFVRANPQDVETKSSTSVNSKSGTDLAMEEGVVTSLKDTFGFIQSTQRVDHVFFHICEVKTDQNGAEIVPSSTNNKKNVREGDEVRFSVVMNGKKKKLNAINIEVLKAGTLCLEEVVPGRRQGLIVMESKAAKKFGRSRPGKLREVGKDGDDCQEVKPLATKKEKTEKQTENPKQGNDTEKDAETEDNVDDDAKKTMAKSDVRGEGLITFFIEDLTLQGNAKDILRVGDQVEFTLKVSKMDPKKRRAVDIVVLRANVETGYVVEVSKNSGLISRGETPAKTLSVRENLEAHRLNDSESGLPEKEVADNYIPFSFSSICDNSTLREGDKVEFAVVTNAKTGQLQASGIRRVQDGDAPLRPENRVNSDLLRMMRQSGTTIIAASRMAKGPDGTFGFPEGWRKKGRKQESDQPAE